MVERVFAVSEKMIRVASEQALLESVPEFVSVADPLPGVERPMRTAPEGTTPYSFAQVGDGHDVGGSQ